MKTLPKTFSTAFLTTLSTTALAVLTSVYAQAAPFTQAQADSGQTVYQNNCASCHGNNLMAGGYPNLVGEAFASKWSKNTLDDLYFVISQQMPQNAPGSLSDQQYTDATAYILQRNGIKPAGQALTPDNLKGVSLAQLSNSSSQPSARASGGSQAAMMSGGQESGGSSAGHGMESTNAQSSQSAASSDGGGVAQGSSKTRTLALTGPTQKELSAASTATDNWLFYNKGYSGERHSSLKQINTDNVMDLQRTCTYDVGDLGGFQVTPQVYKGVMFITSMTKTLALDATTCKLIWEHDYTYTGPVVLETNRGVALYKGKVIRGTADAHLIALDINTGNPIWNVPVEDSSLGYFLSAAPIVWNGMVFIGDAGADWGIKGKMYAYDVNNGSKMWEFDTIPTGDQPGADTWQSADSTSTGGGSMWTSYTLDKDSGLLYVSVGNPAPDFAAEYRPGDNLYTDSVVVLDAKTGKLQRYYQQIANDDKDYDTAAAPVIYKQGDATHVSVVDKAGKLYTYNDNTQKEQYSVPLINVENQAAPVTKEGTHVCPNWSGGAQWSGPSYMNGTLFVNMVDWCGTATLDEVRYVKQQLYLGGAMALDDSKDAIGVTSAVDAATGKVKWQFKRQGTRTVGGITTTEGGLVLTGDMVGNLFALNAKDGSLLYMDNIDNAPIGGGVSTYMVDGTQYLAVAAGNTSRGATGATAVPARVAIYTLQ